MSPTADTKHLENKNVVSRRTLLQAGILGGLSAAVRNFWPTSCAADDKPHTTNGHLRVGVIGLGMRGKYLIGNLPSAARVAAICDCAKSRITSVMNPQGEFSQVLARFAERDATSCTAYQDYRQMLDREKLDAVMIATPDHHHVSAAMRSLLAELDVYLEKPMTLTIREGRWLANLVQRSNRVLQVGSQQRTMDMNRFGCEFVRGGGLARISRVELPAYPGPLVTPDLAAEPIPAGVEWELFCGPAPLRSYHRKLWVKDEFHVDDLLWRGWDLFRDYSGHMMTNWGAHSVDMVQYALGRDNTGPVFVQAEKLEITSPAAAQWKSKTPLPEGVGDRRFWPVNMRYADGTELRFIPGPEGITFHGEKGRMLMRRNWFQTDPPGLAVGGPDPSVLEAWKGDGHVARPHLQNWIDCIRDRRAPNATVEVGHRTATVCHLANIARELNRPLRWDPTSEQFVSDAEANELLDRPRRKGFELPSFG